MRVKKAILSGKIFTPEEQEEEIQVETSNIKDAMASFGNQRTFRPSDISTKTWKEVTKDLEWDLEINVTGESEDTQAKLATLTTVFRTIAGNPMVLDDPRIKMIFNKIVEAAGNISPVELASLPKPKMEQPAMPAGGGQPR